VCCFTVCFAAHPSSSGLISLLIHSTPPLSVRSRLHAPDAHHAHVQRATPPTLRILIPAGSSRKKTASPHPSPRRPLHARCRTPPPRRLRRLFLSSVCELQGLRRHRAGAQLLLRHPPPDGTRRRAAGDASGSAASVVVRPRAPLQRRHRPGRGHRVRDSGRASGLPFAVDADSVLQETLAAIFAQVSEICRPTNLSSALPSLRPPSLHVLACQPRSCHQMRSACTIRCTHPRRFH